MAELLLALLVVSIIVSATIPTFTKKASTNEQVFKWVNNATSADAYFAPGGNNQSIILGHFKIPDSVGGGVLTSNNDNLVLVKNYNATTERGKIDESFVSFYNKNTTGTVGNNTYNVGRLYLDETNIGLGLNSLRYINPTNNTGLRNTAIGQGTLFASAAPVAGNRHSANTAIGFNAMSGVASGLASNTDLHATYGTASSNVAIGMNALSQVGGATANIAIGSLALQNFTGIQPLDYGNTAIGAKSLASLTEGSRNTAIGVEAARDMEGGSDNIAIGYTSLNKYKNGNHNIALGNATLGNMEEGSSNVVIGAETANNVTKSNNSIVIGPKFSPSSTELDSKLLIGSNGSDTLIEGDFKKTDASGSVTQSPQVTINGDLIVKGNIKVEGHTGYNMFSIMGASGQTFSYYNGSATVTEGYGSMNFNGPVGIKGSMAVDPWNVYDGSDYGTALHPIFDGITTTGEFASWRGIQLGHGSIKGGITLNGTISGGGTIEKDLLPKLELVKSTDNASKGGYGKRFCIDPYYSWSGGIICSGNTSRSAAGLVNVKYGDERHSDIRLKDVIGNSNSGLKEINQLEVKNYTYKKDETKTPHVGVIAQSLQKVFPNAVKADEDGYLMIRWEDMFYAMINAIKELYANFQDLAAKIIGLDKRIELLESQNAMLLEQNKVFEKRLEKLEKKQDKKEKKTKLSAPIGEEMEEGK